VTVVEIALPDGERHKNWETLNGIFDALLENRSERGTTLIALGGGVVGDLAGFAAATLVSGWASDETDGRLEALLDTVEWEIEGGNPARGAGETLVTRICTAGSKSVAWVVTTPCGQVCAGAKIIQIEPAPCELSPLRAGLGDPKLGESFILFTTASSPGTISWDAGDATVLTALEAPTELPWVQGPQGYETFQGFRFCTPGQIVSASALVAENPDPSVGEIRHQMAGNLCRCGTYPRIEEAIQSWRG
jgi:hypothetical protein